MTRWKIWIDTGGTFTDCLCVNPDGLWSRLKVLSNGAIRGKVIRQFTPQSLTVGIVWPKGEISFSGFSLTFPGTSIRPVVVQSADSSSGLINFVEPVRQRIKPGTTIELTTFEEVPVFAARLLTGTKVGADFPAIEMKLGSTRGTNAILEHKGARTALLVTRGFGDLIRIGNQQRPDLFAVRVQKPPVLYHTVMEVNERTGADGRVIQPWDEDEIKGIVARLRSAKIESVAIALLNSYRNPVHEEKISAALRQHGFTFVSCSSELSAQGRLLPRAETCVANAYLEPIISRYVGNILNGISNLDLKLMSSAGGLMNATTFRPKDSLLSGPAGGVVGASIVAGFSGHQKLLSFDMGGTSTDVSRYDSRFDYRFESVVGSTKILSPSLAIETIAAGGGSICDFDGYKLVVGPHSAGANPGPACYGAGGPLTITDVNLLLGRIDASAFAMPLSPDDAEQAFDKLVRKMTRLGQRLPKRHELLLSLTEIANEKMAGAIRKVSTQAGHNPADFTLLSFGGAGGQHACALAGKLGMKKVLIPYDAGLLSAYGIGHARQEKFAEELVLKRFHEASSSLEDIFDRLISRATKWFEDEGQHPDAIAVHQRMLYLRFAGQESTIEVEVDERSAASRILDDFRQKYLSIYSYWPEGRVVEIESARAVVVVKEGPRETKASTYESHVPVPGRTSMMWTSEGVVNTACYNWEDLRAGATVEGPAIITSRNSTTVVDKGWDFKLDEFNNALLRPLFTSNLKGRHARSAELELFTNRFTAIAEQMGAMLQRTSFSVNVKERLDFSCALHDARGYLVVNAPHIPVHLGSLGICVRTVTKHLAAGKGDVIITNHPRYGGSHLPDVTLIKGVYVNGELVGYVSNRAHHAEIGGRKPGSMPADARTLEEEGVIISPSYLIRGGVPQWKAVESIFCSGKYPTRSWAENQADLNGALAAINFGETALKKLCDIYGTREVRKQMTSLRSYASALLADKLNAMRNVNLHALERLDDGSVLKVSVVKKKERLTIDFDGTAGVHPGNLNATSAIVQSVVLYVLRLLINAPIPMNEGLMDRVTLRIPKGLLDPFKNEASEPAVVGGNTEVSQRLTDTLIKAFGMSACSQGTMNNFLFGNDQFGYYETICGGTGAGAGFDGCDAVHHHMTNTRITDPELLEWRYPVRLVRFSIRKNSGGRGKWRGGNGIVREMLFLAPLEINILSQHRIEVPFGMKGGMPGKPGAQRIVRKDGRTDHLQGMDSASVEAGDRVVIETPGGGGYGRSR